ncbi:DUF2357 domain-containing protein [Algoriphagus sp. AK58]|uniref:DUF2357 domain-containing protein n=1 Tax=Algoriphagus sp. AK58 TaxID=1406877 RepID=UPI00164F3076|nr:DUF2357 domain-containing protein [Algoriphagus sp. AK58]MBC6368012.1 hypothetical protein [Algoriphagus sp. AK58]
MAEPTSHNFDIPGYGKVELDIPISEKSFYRPLYSVPPKFRVKILGKEVSSDEVFHVFEWQRVTINLIFKKISDAPFSLIVNNNTKFKSKLLLDFHVLNGVLVFENQVGETSLKVINQFQETLLEIEFEVFPLKMDYKSDYRAMVLELSQIIRNLTYSFLKDTYQKAKPKIQGHTTEHEWWSILDELFEIFIKNMETIKRQPKHEILHEEQILPVDRIKRGSVKNAGWFQKNTKFLSAITGLQVVPEKYFTHALSVKKRTSYDTYENRFVVYAIKETLSRISFYRKEIFKGGKLENTYMGKKMAAYQEKLQSFLHQSPFDEVGLFEKRSYFSTTLTKGAGYRDFLQIFMLLNKGLEILNDDIFKIDQKEISTLYEYWCFLKLYELIKGEIGYEMNFQSLIKLKAGKFNVDLRKGNESEIRFKNHHGEELSLYFNKEFGPRTKHTFTYNQIPDFSLKFKKKGYDSPFWYIIDSKYRFNQNKGEAEFDAPDDAIGQLHRYRDAILHSKVRQTTYKSAIKNLGGVILYPFPNEEKDFESNRYYKSIEEVNIGALPFLPGKTSLAKKFLHNLINEKSPEDHFEEYIDMDFDEYSQKLSSFDKWVTIGVIRSANQKERIELLLGKKIHYVPFIKEVASRIYSSKKLLACVSGTDQGYLFEVKDYQVLTRGELKEQYEISWGMRAERYIVFNLSEGFQKLSISPSIIPVNFRYTTQGGLDIYLSNEIKSPRDLYINNLTAYRLYTTLQRRKIEFQVSWGESKSDLSEVNFSFGDLTVITSELHPSRYRVEGEFFSLDKVLSLI